MSWLVFYNTQILLTGTGYNIVLFFCWTSESGESREYVVVIPNPLSLYSFNRIYEFLLKTIQFHVWPSPSFRFFSSWEIGTRAVRVGILESRNICNSVTQEPFSKVDVDSWYRLFFIELRANSTGLGRVSEWVAVRVAVCVIRIYFLPCRSSTPKWGYVEFLEIGSPSF